jgi:hypothetical protein
MDNGRLLLGAALGAGLVYMLDPQSGGRRRALVRDKMTHAARLTRDAVDATSRDIANRSRGLAVATRARFRSENVSDEVLARRVRAKLGRWSSHPSAIAVILDRGNVTLSGPILTHEAPALITAVQGVRGVQSVSNALDMHDSADRIPALQGEGRVPGSSIDLLQSRWAPATQALVAAAGLAATGLCIAAYARRGSS